MKNLIVIVLFLAVSVNNGNSQELFKTSSAGVIAIETRNIDFDPVSLGNVLRNELVKLELFTVIDRYETMHALEQIQQSETTCFGKTCLVELGESLGVEKMFGGTIDRYGGNIIVSLRVVDVSTGKIEKNHIQEFIDIIDNLPRMVGLCLKKMYGLEVDAVLWNKLTNEYDYDNTLNNPDIQRLSLNGPRMGFGIILQDDGKVFTDGKAQGGFEAWPVLSQFGYQFEYSYLNQGKVQALFEIIPMIAGLEQGMFIPSLSILHGVRSNVNGLEFAFGPVFFLNKKAKGFYINDEWHLEKEAENFPDEEIIIERRLDSRGDLKFDSGLVLAVGRTFRSGKVNFPINLVTVLKKSGIRIGLSFGFNASSRNRN